MYKIHDSPSCLKVSEVVVHALLRGLLCCSWLLLRSSFCFRWWGRSDVIRGWLFMRRRKFCFERSGISSSISSWLVLGRKLRFERRSRDARICRRDR
ncbi:Os01g0614750 [Oryza sativa Japonica Group]|uniref:Os01g0614750 protein n=1 Tax=Oryza sativa subsp. japonica TaxID=39947 RepID=A0A0P0V5B8_ORYSJ|nr:hypothetical protein EE612_004053 [Oryza sativa]BAS73150.1 Os01g0614750 [Oryza sativa Japonica Group]